jgi:hypothetical protein
VDVNLEILGSSSKGALTESSILHLTCDIVMISVKHSKHCAETKRDNGGHSEHPHVRPSWLLGEGQLCTYLVNYFWWDLVSQLILILN